MQKLYFAITLTTLTALAGTAAIDPSIIREIAKEDHILENITVAFLAASFILGFITTRTQQPYPKLLSLTLSTLSLIALLDEISFGQRIFNFNSIPITDEYYLNGLHDIAEIAKNSISKSDQSIVVVITFVSLLAICMLSFCGGRIRKYIQFLAKEKLLWFLLLFSALVLLRISLISKF